MKILHVPTCSFGIKNWNIFTGKHMVKACHENDVHRHVTNNRLEKKYFFFCFE